MFNTQIIECVPNFSEGRDLSIIKQITDEIEQVEGVKLLDVDPGKATNRTVVTFVGTPAQVIEAAFRCIKKAAELIDMSKHKGEHPRMGATDVCPLIPIAGISIEETIEWSRKLAKRVGEELNISAFLYEYSASDPRWKSLSNIRAGEYEKMEEKLKQADFNPDFGPKKLNAKAGVTAIGARDILIAYNVNLNTTSVRRANSVAFDVRENGRILREGDPISGKPLKDAQGNELRQPGACKAVAGIGWFIPEYGVAQVSMNLKNINETAIHTAFEECVKSASDRGMRVTGSELVGLVPLQSMLEAGRYFLHKQQRSSGVSDKELIHLAVKSMGLDELTPFDPNKKIIEYAMNGGATGSDKLVGMTLRSFADETASESPAPGGGSIAAYAGALGVSLATMVANLSSQKKGWESRWAEFSDWAERGQKLKDQLLRMVDLDTDSFNAIMSAFELPKSTDAEKAARKLAIQEATKQAIEVPFSVMQLAINSFEVIEQMLREGNPNSITDAAVGALCARTAVHAAFLNVKINCSGLDDKSFVQEVLSKGEQLCQFADNKEQTLLKLTHERI